jgi:hypothetical protein
MTFRHAVPSTLEAAANVGSVGSQLKKAHKTHALAQPAGVEYPHESIPSGIDGSPHDEAERLFREICRLVPKPSDRAELLGVSLKQENAWQNGQQLPILRAQRKALATALVGLRRQPSPADGRSAPIAGA